MKTLYKRLPSEELAKIVASGIFRFYELTKYIKMEDAVGRADELEGSVGFDEEESRAFPEKLMEIKLIPKNGDSITMFCSSIKQDQKFLKQYFVLCLSKSSTRVMKDSGYAVVLNADVFDLFEKFFLPPHGVVMGNTRKMFSHGEVYYYDIHNHPTNISEELWKEVFLKSSKFKEQNEYRASLLISDKYFARMAEKSEKRILEVSKNGEKIDCEIEIKLNAGTDEDGWRYIEIDTSDIPRKLNLPIPEFIITSDYK